MVKHVYSIIWWSGWVYILMVGLTSCDADMSSTDPMASPYREPIVRAGGSYIVICGDNLVLDASIKAYATLRTIEWDFKGLPVNKIRGLVHLGNIGFPCDWDGEHEYLITLTAIDQRGGSGQDSATIIVTEGLK